MQPDLTKATYDNINRIDTSIENSFNRCECCGNPIPSWIEISLIDFCTRRCEFCPKGDDVAPNQKHLFMNRYFINKIYRDISGIKFKGTIMLAGYGEPMAFPYIMEFIRKFSFICRIEMVTNGDLLTADNILEMMKNGLSFIAVSMYDGPEQRDKFKKLFDITNTPEDKYILRDRWYGSDKNFGIKLTNRAGIITVGNQIKTNQNARCFYPHYSMMIDWNGDVLLCPQDWHRRIKFGNLSFDSVHDIWMSPVFKKYRDALFKGKRSLFPCSKCNCDGTLHGKKHAESWYASNT